MMVECRKLVHEAIGTYFAVGAGAVAACEFTLANGPGSGLVVAAGMSVTSFNVGSLVCCHSRDVYGYWRRLSSCLVRKTNECSDPA
jgi:hypothetical protein